MVSIKLISRSDYLLMCDSLSKVNVALWHDGLRFKLVIGSPQLQRRAAHSNFNSNSKKLGKFTELKLQLEKQKL